MKKPMKEMTKRRITKVIFCIVAVVTCFILLANTCFAYQTGTDYDSWDIFNGEATYPIVNVSNFYYTTNASSGRYWKTFPVASSYQVKGNGNFQGWGYNLSYTYQQTIANNSAYTLLAPQSFLGVYSDLLTETIMNSKDYSTWFDGVIDGKDVADPLTAIDVVTSRVWDDTGIDYDNQFIAHPKGAVCFQIQLGEGWYSLDHLNRIFVGGHISTSGASKLNISYDLYYLDGGVLKNGKSIEEYSIPSSGLQASDVELPSGVTVESYGFIFPPLSALSFDKYMFTDGVRNTSVDQYVYIKNFTVSNIPPFGDVYPQDTYSGWLSASLYQPSIRPYIPDEVEYKQYFVDGGNTPNWMLDKNALTNWGSLKAPEEAPSVDDVDVSGFGRFISNSIGSFLDVELLSGVSLGGILFTCLAIGFVFAILKYFAGG